MAKPGIKNTNSELLTALTLPAEEQVEAGFNPTSGLPETLTEAIDAYVSEPTETRGRAINTLLEQDGTGTLRNQFFGNLLQMTLPYVQKVRAWNNPLEQFSKDQEYAQNVEEIAVNLFNSKVYKTGTDNSSPTEAFKQNVPDVRSKIHTVNFQKYFPATINEVMGARAFLNESGLGRLTENISTTLTTSAKFEEYEAFMKAITDQYKKGNIRGEHIEPLKTKEDIVNLSVKVRKVINDFETPTSNYNKAELKTFTPLEDVITLVTNETEAQLVKQVLANAYNMEKAELEGKVIKVPEFEGTGIKILIADRESFINYKKLQRLTTITDPVHLNTNAFLHVHDIFAFSEFTNAYVFTTDTLNDSKVTAVSVTAGSDSIKKGNSLQMTAAVTGDDTNGVYWYVEGQGLESTTNITDSGVLRVDADDPVGEKLTVYAYSKRNAEKVGTKVITVQA